MPVSNNSSEPQYGNIIAVEGNADLVATQLRLLPPSSKILVLPALSTTLPSVSAEPFEARRWVRHVHHAFTDRAETARSFLQSSTSMQPKLVFINGGTVSARVECIYRIAEQLTNGKIDEAEAIFNDLVKDGVAGILRPDPVEEVMKDDIVVPDFDEFSEQEKPVHPQDYRGAIAMEAADRLDNQTAELQSSSSGSAVFEMCRMEDPNSLHANEQLEQIRDQCPETDEEIDSDYYGGEIKKTVIILSDGILDQDVHTARSKRSTFGMLPATTYSPEPPRSSAVSRGSMYDHEEEGDEGDESPYNGDKFEVGHAHVIRVESNPPPRNMRSVKSVDRLMPGMVMNRRRSRSLTPRLISTQGAAHRMAALKGYGHARRASLSDLEKAPKTAFVRAFPTTIKKVSGKSSQTSSTVTSPRSPRRFYVDRGTDAGAVHFPDDAIPLTPDTSEIEIEIDNLPFEPVFAVFEDLVIHFTDGADSSLLESVVRSYKNGSYPITPVPESGSPSSQPCSPRSINGLTEERLRHLSHLTSETDDFGYHGRQESRPYNADNVQPEARSPRWPQRKGARIENSTPAPLSPAATPPPSKTTIAHRFHRFSPINTKTATGIQNSLRAVLNVHFPPELTNYRQYSVPVDSDRLWKPVFRDSDGHSQEGRTVDQIIAIGAEDGVNSNFFNEIAGQVERLGTKKNGTTRSGKLDMRFLIASAMQTFTKQSLSYQSQTSSNPFSSPMLLASLLVPQLETYLASNASTRLLIIHYSASHLPTILALRHLVGVDTLKIAGILNSLSNVPSLNSTPSSPSIHRPVGNRLSNANVAAYNSRTRVNSNSRASSTRTIKTHSPAQSIDFKHNSSEPVSTSFTRANYLLPSTASDVEIATFLSNITNHLIEKSSYYTPEPTLHSVRKISGGLNSPGFVPSPLSPTFPPNSNNTSASRKSPTTTTSNSSRPMTPQGRERENRVGQPINNNIVRPQPNLNTYATSPVKTSFPSVQFLSTTSPKSPQTAFIPPSTTHFSPSLSSTSSISIISAQNQNPTTTSPQSPNIAHAHSNSRPNTSTSQRPNTAAREADARERQSERDWANFYIGESDEEDEIDRILMPRVPRRIERRKGNSRKALKWLGLA